MDQTLAACDFLQAWASARHTISGPSRRKVTNCFITEEQIFPELFLIDIFLKPLQKKTRLS